MPKYSAREGDITQVVCDALLLKYPQRHYGVEARMGASLGEPGLCTWEEVRPAVYQHRLVPTAATSIGGVRAGSSGYWHGAVRRSKARPGSSEAARVRGHAVLRAVRGCVRARHLRGAARVRLYLRAAGPVGLHRRHPGANERPY